MKRIDKVQQQNPNGYEYQKQSDRKLIKQELIKDHGAYCCYTEYHLNGLSSIDIEHFDPDLKGTQKDSYMNWYSVLHKPNLYKKRSWNKYQPILYPSDDRFDERLCFEGCVIKATDKNDQSAINLIEFLQLNKYELVNERREHIDQLKALLEITNDIDTLKNFILKAPAYLSFSKLVENEFGFEATFVDDVKKIAKKNLSRKLK